ncbi:discoidin domain-containing protein [Cohnella nanjingensis]|uniref:Discoidin domain-containing protein n=1 Tax=Cohnella nanjingensis TaxID=1387779 RepID=A0A7X0RPL7_9BACL|nr:discoidin domain-containing protein [Cohnella nanjingensis]MBB6671196.1 discoidin domain-containing protein [Cohnella nanjingensis]
MIRRMRYVLAGAAAVVVLAAASWWAVGPLGKGSKAKAAEAVGYGSFIPVAAVDGKAMDKCAANRAADQSGMSGAEAKSHTHGNRGGTMWCVRTEAGEAAALTFDLGRVEPLGEMWIWNYNEQDNNSPGAGLLDRGLKDVAVSLSADGDIWEEWRGDGYPYRLAKADGSDRLGPTNLDDGRHSPIRFGGVPARYVKLTAAEAPGNGNWAAAEGGADARVFGLAEARFYRYAREVVYGGLIDPVGASDAGGEAEASHPENAVNGYGLSGASGKNAAHGNDPRTMWLLRAGPSGEASITVDLGGTYPLGEMRIWNYNGKDEAGSPLGARGLRDVGISYSIDGETWSELKGKGYPYRFAQADGSDRLAATNLDGGHEAVDFGGVPARYVKLVPQGGAGQGNWGAEEAGRALYGLSALRFVAGAGVAAEPAPEWTGLFSRYEGWTGADGIFSVPLGDASDQPGSAGADTKTLFLFSDTYAGQVQPVSRARESGAIVNNSVGLLAGALPDPAAIRFEWVPKSADLSLFSPHTEQAKALPGSWYWLQDGIAKDGQLHLFPLLMVKDPAQPPGFQFAIRGVTHISVPLKDGVPDYAAQKQSDTPLYRKLPDGGELVFGAGILDNTKEAGAPQPDGYIYTYGYKAEPTGDKRLLVARALPAALGDPSQWRFWDGRTWSERIEDAAPLAEGVSPELSVTPMKAGRWQGKYLLVCERNSTGGVVAYAVGDSPAGPFGPMTALYHTPELGQGQDIVTYNAKAHPHLSGEGELLVTYNVNSTSLAENASNADIYHPRWIRIREIGPAS